MHIAQILAIIDQCQEWFNRDPRNAIAIHCKVSYSDRRMKK